MVKSFNDFLLEKQKQFEIIEKDGEWAIINKSNPDTVLYGEKEKLEQLLNSMNEGNTEFVIKPIGIKGSEYHISINGHEYGYTVTPDSKFSIQEIGEKFVKIMKYSAGRALVWLKKNTILATGSKQHESEDLNIYEFLIALNDKKIKMFESFMGDKDDEDIIDLAISMIDFYGGELPSNPSEYAKVRDILDKDLLDLIYTKALELNADSNESVNWNEIFKKPADMIHADLKDNKYSVKAFNDYKKNMGSKLDPKEYSEFEKAAKRFAKDEEKAKEEQKAAEKNKREIEDIVNKIEKLNKEKMKDNTSDERKNKIDQELLNLDKKIKSLNA